MEILDDRRDLVVQLCPGRLAALGQPVQLGEQFDGDAVARAGDLALELAQLGTRIDPGLGTLAVRGQLGGIGALVPERRSDLAVLGPKVLLISTLANFLSASIAGVLL